MTAGWVKDSFSLVEKALSQQSCYCFIDMLLCLLAHREYCFTKTASTHLCTLKSGSTLIHVMDQCSFLSVWLKVCKCHKNQTSQWFTLSVCPTFQTLFWKPALGHNRKGTDTFPRLPNPPARCSFCPMTLGHSFFCVCKNLYLHMFFEICSLLDTDPRERWFISSLKTAHGIKIQIV